MNLPVPPDISSVVKDYFTTASDENSVVRNFRTTAIDGMNYCNDRQINVFKMNKSHPNATVRIFRTVQIEGACSKTNREFGEYEKQRGEWKTVNPSSDFNSFIEETRRLPKEKKNGE